MGEVVRLIDRHGEYRGEACEGCMVLLKKVAALGSENTRLRNEEQERLGLAPDAKQIMDVLSFHKQLLNPTHGRIVRGGPAWKNVKARLADVDAETEKPAFTALSLKAAVVGLSLSEWHRKHKKTGAAFLFEDPDRVQEHIQTLVAFKRDTGVSALAIVDELGRPGLEKLAAKCSCCGHLRLDHERDRPELDLFDPPCAVHGCACPGFDDFDWKVEVWRAQREVDRRAPVLSAADLGDLE